MSIDKISLIVKTHLTPSFPPHFLVRRISYLREQFDVLVFSQEISAERHPLWHQVQDFSFPLQFLLPVLFPSASLGAIGGIRLRKVDGEIYQRQYTVKPE